MFYKSYLSPLLLILSALTGLTGCGSSSAPLAAVTGSVSYQGQPVGGGIIVFTPDTSRGTHGPMAHAEIQADGTFTLHTEDAAGAVAGWHRITLVLVDEPNPQQQDHSSSLPQNLLPHKYCSPDLSGLMRQVKAGKENVFKIDLD